LGLTLQNAPRFFGGKGLVLEAEKKKKRLKRVIGTHPKLDTR
jgi:hypothetical protein